MRWLHVFLFQKRRLFLQLIICLHSRMCGFKNEIVLFFMILFSWHTVIQKGHREGYKLQPKFQERQTKDEESV